MAVTFDVATENIQAADPQNFSHAGGASPQGVMVLIAHGTVSTDIVAGVTYGGSALTRIQTNTDTATEPGRTYIYFLGSAVPTGTQTVSIDRTEATTSVFAVCITVDATADTEVVANSGINDNVANPQVTLAFGGRNCMSFCILYGGGAAPSSYTSLSDQTRVHDHDFTAFAAVCDRLTTAQTADDTIGYTSSTDDVAFSAFAISEAPVVVAFDAAVTAAGLVAGVLDLALSLDSSVSAIATVAGALDLSLSFNADVQATGIVLADLSVPGIVVLDASIDSSGVMSGVLDVSLSLEAIIAAAAQVEGHLTVQAGAGGVRSRGLGRRR